MTRGSKNLRQIGELDALGGGWNKVFVLCLRLTRKRRTKELFESKLEGKEMFTQGRELF